MSGVRWIYGIESNFHQFVSFKIISAGDPINVLLIYRLPSSGNENLQNLCELLKNLPKNTIIIGDINLPHIDWSSGGSDALGRELFESVQERGLVQLIHFPTHDKGNILDLLITNMANKIISFYNDGKLGKSDHCIIIAKPGLQNLRGKWQKRHPTGQKRTSIVLKHIWPA